MCQICQIPVVQYLLKFSSLRAGVCRLWEWLMFLWCRKFTQPSKRRTWNGADSGWRKGWIWTGPPLRRWQWDPSCIKVGHYDDDDDHFYVVLFAALKQSHWTFVACDSKWVMVAFYSAFRLCSDHDVREAFSLGEISFFVTMCYCIMHGSTPSRFQAPMYVSAARTWAEERSVSAMPCWWIRRQMTSTSPSTTWWTSKRVFWR